MQDRLFYLSPMATSPFSVKAGRSLQASKTKSGLEDWLANMGISIKDQMVLDAQSASLPVPVNRNVGGLSFREIQMVPYAPFPDLRSDQLNPDHPIYRVKLAAYQAPANTDEWLDKEILTVPMDKIVAIDVGDLKLVQQHGKADMPKPPWTADNLPVGKTLNAKAAATLAGQLSGLRIRSLVDEQAVATEALSTPSLTLTLDKQNGKALTYTLARATTDKAGGNKADKTQAAPWYLAVSDQDRTFRITSAVGDALQKAASNDSLLEAAACGALPPVLFRTG